MDARPAAGEQVVALLVDLSSSLVDPPPAEIWLFDLASGEGRPLHEARPALHPLDLDWTGAGVTP